MRVGRAAIQNTEHRDIREREEHLTLPIVLPGNSVAVAKVRRAGGAMAVARVDRRIARSIV